MGWRLEVTDRDPCGAVDTRLVVKANDSMEVDGLDESVGYTPRIRLTCGVYH